MLYVMEMNTDYRYSVLSDTHAQYEKVARAIEAEDPYVDYFVFAGDIVDGPENLKLINLIMELGKKAVAIAGNHEWVLRNALYIPSEPDHFAKADAWRDIWSKYERGVLESYGLRHTPDWAINAENLRQAMDEQGHLSWLVNLPAYFSTPDFVVVHAGPLSHRTWADQEVYLDSASEPDKRIFEEPNALFSHAIANVQDIPEMVENRIFITGHNHRSLPVEERRARNRVGLATSLRNGDPLLIWRSEENKIVSYDQI